MWVAATEIPSDLNPDLKRIIADVVDEFYPVTGGHSQSASGSMSCKNLCRMGRAGFVGRIHSCNDRRFEQLASQTRR